MRPLDVAAALRERGCPAVLVAAWVRDRVGAIVRVYLGPLVTEPIPLRGGCRQLSLATPFLWNQLLAGPLEGVVSRWKERGTDLVWAPDLGDVALLVWADNVFVFASSWADVRVRVSDVSRAIRELGLRFSDSSLEVLATSQVGAGVLEISDTGQSFSEVQVLRVLGIGLDAKGSAQAMDGSCAVGRGGVGFFRSGPGCVARLGGRVASALHRQVWR